MTVMLIGGVLRTERISPDMNRPLTQPIGGVSRFGRTCYDAIRTAVLLGLSVAAKK